MPIDRREFLKLSALALAGAILLPTCGTKETQYDTTTLEGRLGYILGISEKTTQLELSQIATIKHQDTAWLFNSLPSRSPWITTQNIEAFDTMTNDKGEYLTIGLLPDGEPIITLPKSTEKPEPPLINYPDVELKRNKYGVLGIVPRSKFDSRYNNFSVIAYGDETVLNQIPQVFSSSEIDNFLAEFLQDPKTGKPFEFSVRLHLNFVPSRHKIIGITGGDVDFYINPLEKSASTQTIDGQSVDIVLNLERIHREADIKRVNLADEIGLNLVNERMSLIAGYPGANFPDIPYKEAFSTLGGLLFYIDPKLRQVLMNGTTYQTFNQGLTSFMEQVNIGETSLQDIPEDLDFQEEPIPVAGTIFDPSLIPIPMLVSI